MNVYRLQTPLCCAAGARIHQIDSWGFKPHAYLARLAAHFTSISPNTSHVCAALSIDFALDSDLWSWVYQELDEKSRKWILGTSELKPENGKQWTTDLITLVREREEAYKNSTPKLKIGNREIIWRDYANKTVTWLVTIGDIAVNFAPAPSPIIWSALKVFMKPTNVAQCEDLVAIFGCAEKVLSAMRRGAVYETGRQFLHALISPGKGAELVSALSDHELKLSVAVQGCGAVQLQEHQKLLQSLSAPLRRVDDNVKNLVEHLQEKNLDEALDYISTIPIGKHHFEKRETRTPETCEWLLKHRRFLEWEESSCSSTLWLQGSIGAGKSYLTSKVIDRYFFDNEAQRKHDEGFYCSRSDTARRDPKSVYQSYIRQLAQINHYPAGIHKSISDLYRKARKEQRELSIPECKAALSELLKSYPRTTLRPVKVYIASRREPDIERNLGSENFIEIGTSDNKGDIKKYIEQEMNRFGEEWESVSQGVREEVKRTITDQSDGMFRWAYLQWEQLKKFKTDQSILERLGKLPKSLEQAYDEIYSQNEGFELVILQRTIKWVLCAAEPLSNDPDYTIHIKSICCNLIVRESQLGVWKFPHASAAEYFESRHKDWTGKAHEDSGEYQFGAIISDLPLGQLDLDDYFNLQHPLQDYAKRLWAWHARSASNHHRVSPILKRFLGAAGPQNPSSQQYRMCKISIFGICALGLHTLLEGWWDKDIDVSLVNDKGLGLLSIAARHGHRSLCSNLIHHRSDVNRILQSRLGSALGEALSENQIEIAVLLREKSCIPDTFVDGSSSLCLAARLEEQLCVKLLLEHGASVNAQLECGKFGSALVAAARQGWLEIVERGPYGSALASTANRGSLECVKLLVDHGADVNAQLEYGDFGSALVAAFYGWQNGIEIIKYIVEEAGADTSSLSSSPRAARYTRKEWTLPRARYLVKGGYVQASLISELGLEV
ncbi:hypothetical protein GGI35DRAFT_468544 [Trichoderma velutinum]